MDDRETILPLAIGLFVALGIHVLAAAGYGRLGQGHAAPPPALAALDRADLVATALSLPEQLVGDQPVDITAAFANAGSRDAGPFELLVEIDDQPAARATVGPGLPAGGAGEQTLAPVTAAPGVHTVRLTVDPADAIAERDESNNTVEVRRVWDQPRDPGQPVDARPDLSPFAIDRPDTVYAGRPTPLHIGLANLGPAASPPFELVVLVDGQPVAGGTSAAPLGPAAIASIDQTVTFDAPGEYTVCVVADPRNAIDELDETNNRFCQTITVDRAREVMGDPDSNAVSINSISYEQFEQLRARRKMWFDQPTAQTLVDATPDATDAPIDPTDAARVQPATDGAAASNPTPPRPPQPPSPAVARQPVVEPVDPVEPTEPAEQATSPSATEADLPSEAPALADRPGVVAAAPRDDEPTEPVERDPPATDDRTPAELVDTTPTDDPTDAPPVVADPADVLDITNPRQPIDRGDAPTVAVDVPRIDPTDDPARDTPPANPTIDSNPTDAAQPIEGDPGAEPTEAALPVAPTDADPASPQDPAEQPDSDTTGAAEATDGPQQDAGEQDDTPAEGQPVELAMATPPTPPTPPNPPRPAIDPSPTAPASDAQPTVAPRADFEADAVSRITAAEVKPGAVIATRGVKIRTVRPRLSTVARLTALPRNPVVRIRFDGEGRVMEVEFIRSSGFANVDSPLRLAIYKWTAEGQFSEDGFVIERLNLILNDKAKDDSDSDEDDEQ